MHFELQALVAESSFSVPNLSIAAEQLEQA